MHAYCINDIIALCAFYNPTECSVPSLMHGKNAFYLSNKYIIYYSIHIKIAFLKILKKNGRDIEKILILQKFLFYYYFSSLFLAEKSSE
jgi:hypothetical protein